MPRVRSKPGNRRPIGTRDYHRKPRPNRRSKWGYYGVTLLGPDYWRAQVWAGGRYHFAGSARTAEEAARLYDAKSREVLGDAAKLNFPEAS